MGNRKNIAVEVGSILMFALSIFVLFSLFSFQGNDSLVFNGNVEVPQNACGRVGAYIASQILSCFGIGGFLLPGILFFIATTIHRRSAVVPIFSTLGGMAVSLSAVTVFLSLQWKSIAYGGTQILTGGAFGTWIAVWLTHHLNYLGSSLVALLLFCLSLVITTPVSVVHVGTKIIGGISRLILRLVKIGATYLFYFFGLFIIKSADAVRNGLRQLFGKILRPRPSAKSTYRIQNKNIVLAKSNETPGKTEGRLVLQTDQGKNFPEVGYLPETIEPLASNSQELHSKVPSEAFEDSVTRDFTNAEAKQTQDKNVVLSLSDFEQEGVQKSSSKQNESIQKTGGIAILPREGDRADKSKEKSSRTLPKARRGQWQLPTVEFLRNPPAIESAIDRDRLISNSHILKQKFADFGIDGEVTAVRPGPVITLYEFKPGPGVKVSRIAALSDDLSMALSAQSVRILAPLPGKSVVGIEIPSETRETVYLREFLQDPDFYGPRHSIPVVMGKEIGGQTYLSDLARMPHLLCAGQTGSGKSVFMNGLICSLFYRFTPDELRMILVDPKFIEFRAYQDIPHLLLPVVDDPKQASVALKWAVREMERRYRILAKLGARNLATFNQKVDEMGCDVVGELLFTDENQSESTSQMSGGDWIEAFEPDETGAPRVSKLPYIVVIIDELADLMMIAKKEVEISIARIAQKARAAGIHLVIATQRPSTDVITGLIKANLPSRVSFQLASYVDSKTILDRAGAERLLGQGDMLFIPPGVSQTIRLHGSYLDDEEINKITTFLRSQGKPAYRVEILLDEEEDGADEGDSEDSDELFQEGIELVKRSGHASASFLQRHLKIGYNRAARMIETMESRGIVGPQDGARPREVLMR